MKGIYIIMGHLSAILFLFYTELVTRRENISEGVKKRITDGAKFVKRKAAQAHEAIRTMGCMVIAFVDLSCNFFVFRCCW